MIGSADPVPAAPPSHQGPSANHTPTTQHRSEASIIRQLQVELDKVRTTLWPSVDTLITQISPSSDSASTHGESGKPTAHALDVEHRRLNELLLQSLLRLDAVTLDGSWDDARKERKGAVKEVQGLLDKLDDAWGRRVI
jgi:BAG domain